MKWVGTAWQSRFLIERTALLQLGKFPMVFFWRRKSDKVGNPIKFEIKIGVDLPSPLPGSILVTAAWRSMGPNEEPLEACPCATNGGTLSRKSCSNGSGWFPRAYEILSTAGLSAQAIQIGKAENEWLCNMNNQDFGLDSTFDIHYARKKIVWVSKHKNRQQVIPRLSWWSIWKGCSKAMACRAQVHKSHSHLILNFLVWAPNWPSQSKMRDMQSVMGRQGSIWIIILVELLLCSGSMKATLVFNTPEPFQEDLF